MVKVVRGLIFKKLIMTKEKKKNKTKAIDETLMKELYFDPSKPSAFGGVQPLVRELRRLGKTYTPKEIREWLSKQDTYTLHKPVQYNFLRSKTVVGGLHEQMQCDLVDMQSLASSNDGNRYIMTCIDVFSRKAYAEPMLNKSAQQIILAFENILKRTNLKYPMKLQTDKGSEFKNKLFQDFLKEKEIHFFTSENEDTKAAIVERWNRTLKTKMWKFFTFVGSHRYLDALQLMVDAYNDSVHRTLGMKPNEVTSKNQEEVWKILYGIKNKNKRKRQIPFHFDVGDKVRISKAKVVFRKGYKASWTDEVYFIKERLRRQSQPIYRLRDFGGEPLLGTFYEKELQKIIKSEQDSYAVDEILKTRGKGAKKEYLVHWRGYDSKYDSWVPAKDVDLEKPPS